MQGFQNKNKQVSKQSKRVAKKEHQGWGIKDVIQRQALTPIGSIH